MKQLIVAIVFVLMLTMTGSSNDFVHMYLQGRVGLQYIVSYFASRSMYKELYKVLEEILDKTNSYEVKVEKVKIGYPLGENIMNDFYEIMDTNAFDGYIYSSVFSDDKLLGKFSKYLLEKKRFSEVVFGNFSRVCFLNNHIEPVVDVVLSGLVTNGLIISDLINRLYSFLMFREIAALYRRFRGVINFDSVELSYIARALGELGDEESLMILSSKNPIFTPLRVEFMIRFGYIKEGIEEVKLYGISPGNAKYVVIGFLNLNDVEGASIAVNYILDAYLKKYLMCVIDIFKSRDIIGVERKLKELLATKGVDGDIKNQVAVLLWIINTSQDKDAMNRELLFALNYLNNIKTENIERRILEKIEEIKKLN
ncbi:MAG: hypothetical protein N2712_02545 [Brevinematales bacterium]|nr:hypothetical protein [Brevinematales bacterium]